MTIYKRILLPGLVTVMLTLSGTVTAADDLISGKGKIQYLNLQEGEIVVGDVGLSLGNNYVVKDRKGKVVSAFNLRKGAQVEVKHDSRNVVKEIIIK